MLCLGQGFCYAQAGLLDKCAILLSYFFNNFVVRMY